MSNRIQHPSGRSRTSACCRKAEHIVWLAGTVPVPAKLYQRAMRGVTSITQGSAI